MEKYAPLCNYLRQISPHETEAILTFAEIEKILGDGLPPSAYRYMTWWANERKPRLSQRQSWQEAGWKVKKVNLGRKEVFFYRPTVA